MQSLGYNVVEHLSLGFFSRIADKCRWSFDIKWPQNQDTWPFPDLSIQTVFLIPTLAGYRHSAGDCYLPTYSKDDAWLLQNTFYKHGIPNPCYTRVPNKRMWHPPYACAKNNLWKHQFRSQWSPKLQNATQLASFQIQTNCCCSLGPSWQVPCKKYHTCVFILWLSNESRIFLKDCWSLVTYAKPTVLTLLLIKSW